MDDEIMTTPETVMTGMRAAKGLMKKFMMDFEPITGMKDLNSTHYRTLSILNLSGRACMKDICRKIGLEAGSFTPVADKLMEEKLVIPIPDEKDRRRKLLALTGEGERLAGELRKQMGVHLENRLSSLPDDLRAGFIEAMDVLRKVDSLLEENR